MLRVHIKVNGVVTNAANFQTEAQIDEWYDFNKDYFPEGHVKEVTSLVDMMLEKQRDQESEEAIELGTKLIAKIRKINRRKLKLGLWKQNKFNELLANQTATQIERALWNGSLGTAAFLLTNMSEFYSDIEIAEIVALINAHETKWQGLI